MNTEFRSDVLYVCSHFGFLGQLLCLQVLLLLLICCSVDLCEKSDFVEVLIASSRSASSLCQG